MPDIALAIGIIARFSTNAKENYMMAVKIILRYLKGMKDYGLWYKKGGKFELKSFVDADWPRSIDDKKCTNGETLFLGKRLVSWTSKKKNYISHSTNMFY